METLFTQALGFNAPWRLVSVDFRLVEGGIAFQLEKAVTRLKNGVRFTYRRAR